MILVDNRNVLRLRNRELLNHLSTIEENEADFKVVVESSKAGVPTLKLDIDGKTQYVHSKYDPEKEATRLIAQMKDVEYSRHVLFVGSGLGYHIQNFTEQYPDMKFSIYEPNEEVLVSYLSNRNLPQGKLDTIFTGTDETALLGEVAKLLQSSGGLLHIYTLPVYESVYGDQVNAILQKALKSLKDKHNALGTNLTFQKRWTINSIKNFPTVLKTPNILHDVDKSVFEGKPAIIVAAGPSLNEEFANLRYIKENGLAYIFSVGSAINALIENGIHPDAACTYDPSVLNQAVIQKIKDKEITDIPLVFGSSVGFETLEDYPGSMLHMITSQDTITPFVLGSTEEVNIVLDAPSIAVVTFQLLTKLGCSPIILVGQNLGYQDNKRYASGIEYDFVKSELNEAEIKGALTTIDVYGNKIETNDSFNRMRKQLELHISLSPGVEVFNTTKGGARIDGTEFIQLEKLMKQSLTTKVFEESWVQVNNEYNLEEADIELMKFVSASKALLTNINRSLNELRSIQQAINLRKSKDMEKRFTQFDNEFNKLKSNVFYKAFIEPMVRVAYERLAEDNQLYRFQKDGLKKGQAVVQSYGSFLQECTTNYQFVLPLFNEMVQRIQSESTE